MTNLKAIERLAREIWDARYDPTDQNGRVAAIRDRFGVLAEGLPFEDIAAAGTAEALRAAIESNAAPSPLVTCLQSQGAGCPLFLIHAGGGYVFFYRAFASHLAPDHPVYGIRAEVEADGLGQPLSRCASLEDLAARYIDRMKAVQPRGPYAVGGGSLGGVVAFEIARQLRAAGEEVQAVVMFSPVLIDAPSLGSKIVHNAGSEALSVLRSIGRRLHAPQGAVPASAATPAVRREPLAPALLYRCTLNLRAGTKLLTRYKPRAYDGRVLLFGSESEVDRAPRWTGLALGGLDAHRTPGGHLDMLEEPAAGETAVIVRRHLESRHLASRRDVRLARPA